jgi:hypothetical protein
VPGWIEACGGTVGGFRGGAWGLRVRLRGFMWCVGVLVVDDGVVDVEGSFGVWFPRRGWRFGRPRLSILVVLKLCGC